jgi:putative ABC transport system substrate-binding protein
MIMNAGVAVTRCAAAFLVSFLAVSAGAEEAKRMGILFTGSKVQRDSYERVALDVLREKGFVEGRNLVITRRYADGDASRLNVLAREIEATRPDVVLSMCTPSTRAMMEASATTPIVMGMVSDPVGQKLIDSLSRPGHNITGTANQYDEVLPKMLEALAAVLPPGARVAVLTNETNVAHGRLWPIAEEAGNRLRLTTRRFVAKDPASVPGLLESMLADQHQAIFVLPDDPMLSRASSIVSSFAIAHRMATLYSAREFVVAGGLLSYGTSFNEGYRVAATYVDRILRGDRPSQLPVSLPTQFELTINMKTARAIGVTVPEALKLRADRLVD